MTEAEFWELIEKTKCSEPDEHVERLVARLVKLPASEILSFGHWWGEAHTAAYDWNLWGAAYIINGGCSDDGFIDFRSWLLLKGEKVYRDALADPDTLAKVRVEPDEASCECYPAPEAYSQAVSGADHGAYYNALTAAHGLGLSRPEPLGEHWDFESETEMKARLTRLFKKFGDA